MRDPSIDLGTRLREARQRQGRTLGDIAAITKIPAAWLAAIERNEFERLPEGLFRRAYVRAFAAEVRVDPEPLPDALRSNPHVHLQPSPHDGREAWRSRLPTLLAYAFLVAAFLLARATWDARDARSPGEPDRQEGAAPATSAATADRGAGEEPVAPAAAAARASLELQFVAPCWVSASVDGKRTIHRLVASGERLKLEAVEKIAVELGDAGAVQLSINGGTPHVPGAPGEVVRLSVEPPLDASPAGTEA